MFYEEVPLYRFVFAPFSVEWIFWAAYFLSYIIHAFSLKNNMSIHNSKSFSSLITVEMILL